MISSVFLELPEVLKSPNNRSYSDRDLCDLWPDFHENCVPLETVMYNNASRMPMPFPTKVSYNVFTNEDAFKREDIHQSNLVKVQPLSPDPGSGIHHQTQSQFDFRTLLTWNLYRIDDVYRIAVSIL